MRHQLKNVVTTGCLFLCLGGWVYNGRAVLGDEATQARETVLNAAIQSGTPVLLAQATGPAAGTGAAATITSGPGDVIESMSVVDADIGQILGNLAKAYHKNIITSHDVKGTVTVNIYNQPFEKALEIILKSGNFKYITEDNGNIIYVYSSDEYDKLMAKTRKTNNMVVRLKYINAQDASVLVKPLLSSTAIMALTPPAVSGLPDGVGDMGGPSFGANDTLVINDYPENLNEVTKALREIDVRPKQVLIESTILRASLTENNALGIDLISLSGVDFSSLTNAAFTTNTSASSSGSTSGTSGSTGTGTQLFGPNGIFNNFSKQNETNVGTDFASQVPTGGLSVGFLSNNIAIYMRALESVTDTTVVANPKILTLNRQRGEVFIGQEFGYKTTTTSTTTTQETVQFLDTGTKLLFRPYITDDGYVRMEIHPEDSAGGLDSNSLPQKQSTEVSSNIMVKDGRTVVIGGLFRELTTAGRGQVPVLGNIPILGVPFRQTNDATQRTETIVLLTPHIINDDTSLYEEAEKQAQDVNRMMLGNRAGLQPWGRDRIAQLWYGKAQESLEAGDKEKALMYVDWALNTNPRFIEAIKFREKLTSRKVEEPDTSSVSHYVRDVLKDDAATTPDLGGAGHYPAPEPATAPAK